MRFVVAQLSTGAGSTVANCACSAPPGAHQPRQKITHIPHQLPRHFFPAKHAKDSCCRHRRFLSKRSSVRLSGQNAPRKTNNTVHTYTTEPSRHCLPLAGWNSVLPAAQLQYIRVPNPNHSPTFAPFLPYLQLWADQEHLALPFWTLITVWRRYPHSRDLGTLSFVKMRCPPGTNAFRPTQETRPKSGLHSASPNRLEIQPVPVLLRPSRPADAEIRSLRPATTTTSVRPVRRDDTN